MRLIFGCYLQIGSWLAVVSLRLLDAVRFVKARPAAGFSYGSRARYLYTTLRTGAAKAASSAIAGVAVTALFVTVWFWHWRICRHLSWTPIREAHWNRRKGYSECARCRQPARRPGRQDRRTVPCVSCQFPIPPSRSLSICLYVSLSVCLAVRLSDSIPSVLADWQRDGRSPSSPLKFSLYISNTNRCVEQI